MDLVSPAATRVVFPLRVMIGLEKDQSEWLYPIARDAVALHITAFAMEGFVDSVLHRRDKITNPAAMLHFEKGLKLLRARLLGTDDDSKVSDSTISVVWELANTVHFDGDHQTAKHHMEGPRRTMDLRGGPDVFRGMRS